MEGLDSFEKHSDQQNFAGSELAQKAQGLTGITQYLQQGGKCDLFNLLDQKYWDKKEAYLPPKVDLDNAIEQNKEVTSGQFEGKDYHPFLELTRVKDKGIAESYSEDLYWQNEVDKRTPYGSGLNNREGKSVLWNVSGILTFISCLGLVYRH